MNDFDKIIKDKIGSIEEMPPAHLWDNISKEIVVPQAAIPFYKSSKFIISAAVASIVVVLGAMWIFDNSSKNIDNGNNYAVETNKSNTDNEINVAAEKPLTEDKAKTKSYSQESVSNKKEGVIKKNKQESVIVKEASIGITPIDETPKDYKKIKMSYNANSSDNSNEQIAQEEADNTTEQQLSFTMSLNQLISENTVVVNESNEEVEDERASSESGEQEKVVAAAEEINEQPPTENQEIVKTNTEEDDKGNEVANNDTQNNPDDEMPESKFNPRTSNYDKIGIGAHFGLENINIDKINIATYNADMSFNYQNMNFIAQTGIGFQMSKDKNDYHQYISTNEYQATQIRFDSVEFVPDGNGGLKPVPVSPTYVDVYDTVNHTYSSDVTETYYSIRIPLMLGYQKSFKKFGFFGKGGIIYSHIFKNNTGNMNEVDDNSVLLSTDYQLVERRSNQLQYVVSAGVSYEISKKMFFNAELMGKYYQYTMYTNSNYDSNPWSYEARLGIIYLLN